MSNNLKSLEKVQNRLIKSIESDRSILDLMRNDRKLDSINETDLSKLLAIVLSNNFAVNYENGVLTELISSGSLKDIENDSIRGLLSSWEGKIYGLREKEKIVGESWTRSNIFFETNGTLRTIFDQTKFSVYLGLEDVSIVESNKPLMKSTIFENFFLIHLGVLTNLNDMVYSNFEKDITSLISLIEEELETKKNNER